MVRDVGGAYSDEKGCGPTTFDSTLLTGKASLRSAWSAPHFHSAGLAPSFLGLTISARGLVESSAAVTGDELERA